jgi:ribosomal-protein-alanine N-acetyltransferase
MLVDPALPAGSLRTIRQPRLDIDEHLVLRPWQSKDTATVRAAFGCPDIQRWHLRRLDSDDEARDWITYWSGRWTDESAASWAIVRSTDDQAVGQVGLRMIVLSEASAHLSYWVLPTARGEGVAVRAVHALTSWAFGTLRLNRLSLVHSIANRASCRVAQKTAYGVEGTMRGYMLLADGWHDSHLHARLRTDTGQM